MSKLGECINYTRQREISQVVKAQKLANISSCLPLLPSADSDTLDTYFWVNNFDHVVEKIAGGNAVSTTHLMAFQEPKSDAEVNVLKISVAQTGKLTFEFGNKHLKLPEKMNPKIEQRQIDTTNKQNFTQDTKLRRMFSVWIWLRQDYGPSGYTSKNNKIVPNFAGN